MKESLVLNSRTRTMQTRGTEEHESSFAEAVCQVKLKKILYGYIDILKKCIGKRLSCEN